MQDRLVKREKSHLKNNNCIHDESRQNACKMLRVLSRSRVTCSLMTWFGHERCLSGDGESQSYHAGSLREGSGTFKMGDGCVGAQKAVEHLFFRRNCFRSGRVRMPTSLMITPLPTNILRMILRGVSRHQLRIFALTSVLWNSGTSQKQRTDMS